MHKLLAAALALALTGPVPRQDPAPAGPFLCAPCGAECHFKEYAAAGSCGVCGMALVPAAEVPQVGVLLAPNADLLSTTLPLGIFAGSGAVRAFTVADARAKFRAGDALDMTPQFTFADAPALDVLVVPATFGLFSDELVLEYLRTACGRAKFVLAIDAGALLLAQAGVLDGATVPGNRFMVERAKELAPKTIFDPELRSARHGKFLVERDARGTMDAVLEILAELAGAQVAESTALELGLGEGR